MFSSKDFEKCWFLYQSEGLPHNISIEEFCLQQGVPVNEFNKWYRSTHKRIHPIQVDGAPSPEGEKASRQEQGCQPEPVRIAVTLCMTNGLHIQRKNLSYDGLVKFVEKLEVLC